jgi:hypothetical protein
VRFKQQALKQKEYPMAANRFQSEILTSIRGRELGLDQDRFLTGPLGWREPLESLSAGTTLETFGTSVLTGSTATFTLLAPERIGQQKEIINASSISTATMAVVRSTANGACNFLPASSGSTEGATEGNVKRINLLNVGSRVVLRAISSAQWAAVSYGTTPYFSMSTTS